MCRVKSKSTDKLEILCKLAEAAVPHISQFSKVTVELTWDDREDITLPYAKVVMEK